MDDELYFESTFSSDQPNVVSIDACVEYDAHGARMDHEQDEIWVSMKDWEGFYEISNFGRIRRVASDVLFPNKTSTGNTTKGGHILAPLIINSGYDTVTLYRKNPDGTIHSERRTVHREVAKNFVENPDPQHNNVVNHKNGNKRDNTSTNLEWCTQTQNAAHAVRTGLNVAASGLDHSGCVMTKEMVIDARRRVRAGEKLEDIAKSMGVGTTTVCTAVTGVTFSEVTEEPPFVRECGGFNSKLCKVQKEQVSEIMARLESGEPIKEIAKDFNCHARTVRQAIRRFTNDQTNGGVDD